MLAMILLLALFVEAIRCGRKSEMLVEECLLLKSARSDEDRPMSTDFVELTAGNGEESRRI